MRTCTTEGGREREKRRSDATTKNQKGTNETRGKKSIKLKKKKSKIKNETRGKKSIKFKKKV